jgi:uncharacterized RDD family membrane protein YckC
MKCPSCGYVSFDRLAACGNCGAPMCFPPPAAAPPAAVEIDPPPGDGQRRRRTRRSPSGAATAASECGVIPGNPDETLAVDDEDLDLRLPSREDRLPPVEDAPAGEWPATLVLQSPFLQDGGEEEVPAEGPPIVDRVEEVPERFWAPEGAGFLRRAAALLIDQALLAALLGLFLAGASLALVREGLEASTLLSRSGIHAALLPLALLAALLNLVYHVPFDAVTGRTPGRRLAGLEVRSGDGSPPSWGSAALRWCGGALGLACAGVGIAWALFEPRRRGWADLLSNTVIVERVPEEAGRAPGRGGAPA